MTSEVRDSNIGLRDRWELPAGPSSVMHGDEGVKVAERQQKSPIEEPGDGSQRDPKPEQIEEPGGQPDAGEFPSFDNMPTEDPTELPKQPGT
ncbi:MAG: hypothetical protein GIW99_10480 [Candidatus Eremiobacteraeota bacterium]|nr:hypothetical protein [Candidatus Eremiobacteraeota bacterium]